MKEGAGDGMHTHVVHKIPKVTMEKKEISVFSWWLGVGRNAEPQPTSHNASSAVDITHRPNEGE